ncbi:MAG: EMC3/TMCO1 family protein [Candidatus Pacearchaeota archaeon]
MDKEGSFRGILIVMGIAMGIAFLWDRTSFIRETAHSILDPTAGALLGWDITWGMILIVFGIAFIMTLVQKYGTDQEALREMKKEQKEVQEEMKKLKDHPEKLMEMQKKHFTEFMPKMLKLSMKPIVYTMIPIILFFRWFSDFFSSTGGIPVLGISVGWIWFYILGSIIFSIILKKIFKVV